MRNSVRLVSVLLAAALVTGCGTTHYLYRADGEVSMTDGDVRSAALYWYGEEGRTWYGWPYEQTDTSLTMRVCGVVATSTFALDDSGTQVELLSDANDLRVARIDEAGEIELLAEPGRIAEGGRCGVILVGGRPVATDALAVGVRPVVGILCRDPLRPDSYPAVARHPLAAVARSAIGDDAPGGRRAPDPCVAASAD